MKQNTHMQKKTTPHQTKSNVWYVNIQIMMEDNPRHGSFLDRSHSEVHSEGFRHNQLINMYHFGVHD